MDQKITYRIASQEDYPAILVLYNKMYKSNRSLKDFEWLVENNPAGRATLFIALMNDKLVGMQSLIPYIFLKDGEKISTYKSEDTLVEKRLRGKGIFSQLYRMVHTQADLNKKLVWGLTDKKEILERVDMPSSERLTISIAVNKPSIVSDRKGLHRLVAKTLFYSFLYVKSAFGTKKVRTNLIQKEIDPSNYGSQELKTFFENLTKQNPGIYYPLMDLEYLQWRFNENPNLSTYKIVTTLREDGSIAICSLIGLDGKAAFWQSLYALPDISVNDRIAHVVHWKKKTFETKIDLIHSWLFECNSNVKEVKELFYQSGFSKVRDGLWIVHNSRHVQMDVHDLYFCPQLGIR